MSSRLLLNVGVPDHPPPPRKKLYRSFMGSFKFRKHVTRSLCRAVVQNRFYTLFVLGYWKIFCTIGRMTTRECVHFFFSFLSSVGFTSELHENAFVTRTNIESTSEKTFSFADDNVFFHWFIAKLRRLKCHIRFDLISSSQWVQRAKSVVCGRPCCVSRCWFPRLRRWQPRKKPMKPIGVVPSVVFARGFLKKCFLSFHIAGGGEQKVTSQKA